MIIAIDESGSFAEDSKDHCFFVAARLRQGRTLYKAKELQFMLWKRTIPKALKNAKGEIKSSLLTEDQLFGFVKMVVISKPRIGFSPVAILPVQNLNGSWKKISKYK